MHWAVGRGMTGEGERVALARVVRESDSVEPQIMTVTAYEDLGKKVPGGKSSDVQTGTSMACLRARKKASLEPSEGGLWLRELWWGQTIAGIRVP